MSLLLLAPEILEHIISFLDLPWSPCKLAQTCMYFRDLIDYSPIWKDLDLELPANGGEEDSSKCLSHKDLFARNYRLLRREFLEGKYSSVRSRSQRSIHDVSSVEYYSPLHISSLLGDLDAVRGLVAQGADVNKLNTIKQSALHFACASGRLEVIRFLLLHNANIARHDGEGMLAIHYAVKWGRRKTVELLLESGADVDAVCFTNLHTPLHDAAFSGYTGICEVLVSRGASLSSFDLQHQTPLACAVRASHRSVASFLLSQGADPWLEDQFGFTCIARAFSLNDWPMMEIFLAECSKACAKGEQLIDILRVSDRSSSFVKELFPRILESIADTVPSVMESCPLLPFDGSPQQSEGI